MIGSQSTAKTVFLLASMVGWLIVGAALMYLFPAIADGLVGSELTHLWMANLTRSGYNPTLGWLGGGLTLALTLAGNWVWYQNVPQRVDTDGREGDRQLRVKR